MIAGKACSSENPCSPFPGFLQVIPTPFAKIRGLRGCRHEPSVLFFPMLLRMIRLSTLLAVASAVFLPAVAIDDFGDHPGFAHAMEVRTQVVDGQPVVFHYGQVRPEFAQDGKSTTRDRRPLGQGWKFCFDPKSSIPGASTQLPAGKWIDVSVPHCWDMMPGGRFHDWSDTTAANPPHYNGAAWYRLEIEHHAQPGKRQRLEFLGVQQRARIFLNGSEIALHEGGGQPFSIDVTDHLRDGTNLLALKVIRRANHEPFKPGENREPAEIEQIHGPFPKAPDKWPYAGITREVSLITENPATVRKTLIRTTGDAFEAAVVVWNAGPRKENFRIGLASPALATALEPVSMDIDAGAVRVIRFKGPLSNKITRWSPDKPALHRVKVELRRGDDIIDDWEGSFGIREVAVKEGRIRLNGSPVFLKGVAMYDETHERGAALLPEDHRRLLGRCRDAGANFIRLHVMQRSPRVYQAADRLGFMVTGEWGGFWYREKSMDAQTRDPQSIFQSHARCAIWDMMNHPSVIMWCMHNESHQFCPEYGRFVAMANGIVRELDWHNRPTTWAAWHPHKGQPEYQHCDIVGFNQYRGAMDPFEELDPDMERATAENPGKPLLILENGSWAKPGNRGGINDRNTEDWQADLLKRQHKVLTTHIPPLAGYTYWLLVDYRSRKFYTAGQDGYSHMGLYGPRGEVKLVRDVFRDLSWPMPE